MRRILFTKAVASGNDFVIIEKRHASRASRLAALAKTICDRRFGAGADGLIFLEKSAAADIKMRIFNSDGSEAQMCGNGARCVALYCRKTNITIETKAGIVKGKVRGEKVGVKLTDPSGYEPVVPIKINGRELKVNSINTGVPHAVIFVDGIECIDVSEIGRQVRYLECFAPSGTNVDFVEALDSRTIKVRTYERGVEDETLACGTGAAASAIAASFQLPISGKGGEQKINVITRGGETLRVYFNSRNGKINNVWLEGKARIVYKGEYYV